MAEVKPSPIIAALERVDEYLATEIVEVVKDLVEISHTGEDDRSRVSAASKLLDYSKPPKPHQGPIVQINNLPNVTSSLGLPAGRRLQKSTNPKAVEGMLVAKRTIGKILPEPSPLHRTSFKGHFDASNPQQPAAPVMESPGKLEAKSKSPKAPEQPPPAGEIKMLKE